MEPKFFRLSGWDWSSHARVRDRRFRSDDAIPPDFAGALVFGSDNIRNWDDLIITGSGVMLFSERVLFAFEAEGIKGLKFCPAVLNVPYSRSLRARRRPEYFWGRAEGIIEIDQHTYEKEERAIPIAVSGSIDVDLFHLKIKRGLAGYACNRRALEALRKHQIGNIELKPLDCNEPGITDGFNPFNPPYQINLYGDVWPPINWYPDNFIPHPNNAADFVLPDSNNAPVEHNTGAYGFDEVNARSSGCDYELSAFQAHGWDWYLTPGSWCADMPEDLGAFLGHGITIKMDRLLPAQQRQPSKRDLKLLDDILAQLPQILAKAEEEFKRYENPTFLEQIFDPTICISCSELKWRPEWALVVEHLRSVGYGCHINFEGCEFKEIWSAS